MSVKPRTASEWFEHAEMLHGRGLETVDLVENLKNTPTDVARVHIDRAQMYFLGAQSATALAVLLAQPDSTP